MSRPQDETSQDVLIRAERRLRSFALRKTGATYRQIAEVNKTSVGTAYSDVSSVLEEIREEVREDAKEVLEMDLHRLDAMMVAIWPSASDGNLNAVDRVLKIIQQRHEMLGPPAPEDMPESGAITITQVYMQFKGQPWLRDFIRGYHQLVAKRNNGAVAQLPRVDAEAHSDPE